MRSQLTEVTSSYRGRGFAGGPVNIPSISSDSRGADFDPSTDVLHPFDFVKSGATGRIIDGVVYVGSLEVVSVTGINIPSSFSGSVYLTVSWTSSGAYTGAVTAYTGSQAPAENQGSASRKLYDFSDGKPTMDYRLAPVFVMYN